MSAWKTYPCYHYNIMLSWQNDACFHHIMTKCYQVLFLENYWVCDLKGAAVLSSSQSEVMHGALWDLSLVSFSFFSGPIYGWSQRCTVSCETWPMVSFSFFPGPIYVWSQRCTVSCETCQWAVFLSSLVRFMDGPRDVR
jgi:hypothetical protein